MPKALEAYYAYINFVVFIKNEYVKCCLQHAACSVGDMQQGALTACTGNTKGGSITVQLTSCLTGLELAVCQLTIFVFICKTD
jgi:hypothetical protein